MRRLNPSHQMIEMGGRSFQLTSPYLSDRETAGILLGRGLELVAGIVVPVEPRPHAGFYICRSLVKEPARSKNTAEYSRDAQGGYVDIIPSNQLDDYVEGLTHTFPTIHRLYPLRGDEKVALIGREAVFGAELSANDPDQDINDIHVIVSTHLPEGSVRADIVISDVSENGTAVIANGYTVLQ